MTTDAAEPIERWTAKRRVALVLSLLKGETSAAEHQTVKDLVFGLVTDKMHERRRDCYRKGRARHMIKDTTYKNYTIRSNSVYLSDTEQWKLTIAITWERSGGMTSRRFSGPITYSTRQEADDHGIAFGQQIVDGKVPGLSVN